MWSLHIDRPLRMTSTEGCGPSGSGGYCARSSLVSARFGVGVPRRHAPERAGLVGDVDDAQVGQHRHRDLGQRVIMSR